MSLITQISSALTRIGTEFKNVYSITGTLANLGTNTKSNLVAAINENVTNIATKIPSSAIGAANGVAGLDSNGLLLASQWPAGIDEIIEYANAAAFPATGATHIIYLAQDTNNQYRWSGSQYVNITTAGGGLSSFNGRTASAAVPTAGDYDAFYYTQAALGDPTTNLVNVFVASLS